MVNRRIVVVSVFSFVVLLALGLFVNNQLSGLQAQISELQAQNNELERLNSELEERNGELQIQISKIQAFLSNLENQASKSPPVEIVDFSPVYGQPFMVVFGAVEWEFNVTVRNSGVYDVDCLMLEVRMFKDGEEVARGAKQLDTVLLFEERVEKIIVRGSWEIYGPQQGYCFSSVLKLGDQVLSARLLP